MTTRRNELERLSAQSLDSTDLRSIVTTEERSATLSRILTTTPARESVRSSVRQWAWARPVAVASLALAVSVAVAAPTVLGPDQEEVDFVATPQSLIFRSPTTTDTASEVLTNLAGVAAARLPDADGSVDYIRTQGWYYDVAVSDGVAEGTLNVREGERWVTVDGAMRNVSGEVGTSERRVDEYSRDYPPRLEATGDAAELERNVPHQMETGTAGWFTAISDLWSAQLVPPQLQAEFLELLATKPGLVNLGSVTDRAGREGVAVRTRSDFSGLPTDYILIFDPGSGDLLAYEMVVLEAGKLPLVAPATTSYKVWLDSERVASVGQRPN